MKKSSILATALLAAAGAAMAVPASSAPGLGASSALVTRTVALPAQAVPVAYDRGVARVQRALNDLGYSAGPVDGVMGSATRSAIRSYQHDHGLAVDGRISRDLVRSLRTARRDGDARGGGTGPSADVDASTRLVIDVQTGLRRAGYGVPEVSGALDAATETAIRTYQADHGLLTTGQPTEQLLAHIQQNAEAAVSSDAMSRRELVQATQAGLNDLGYAAGPADGVMGARTRSAIRTYQADADLAVTGDVSADLLARIRATDKAPGTADGNGASSRQATRLTDGFSDGDYTSNPRWQVLAGSFQVVDGALRSTVQGRQPSETDDVEEVAREVLKGVISQTLGVPLTQRDNVAAIATPAPLSNAFRIQARVGSVSGGGTFAIGPYQGSDASTGYRIQIAPGQQPAARILALGPNGDTRVVATSADRISINGGGMHAVDWRRDADGAMRLIIDGHTAITTSDMGFSQPFSGVALVNGGGTWTVDDLTVESPAG